MTVTRENLIGENILDRYEILMSLDLRDHVFLVKDRQAGHLFVEKYSSTGDKYLYNLMKNQKLRGIPHIHEMSEEQGKLVFVEDYIYGENLDLVLERHGGTLPEKLLSGYILQLCRILKQFHTMDPPVIHRDIKPANILLTKDGVVYLIDFNSARTYKPESEQDTSYMVSHHFSAPELYGFGQSDPRTDIYSIGATMHFLLTGGYLKEKPYQGALQPIIRKCTEMNPKDRYQNLAELEEALMKTGPGKSLKDASSGHDLLRKAEDDLDQGLGEGNRYVRGIHLDRDKMIPGFRTMYPLKILTAILGYSLIFFLCLTMDLKTSVRPELAVFDCWVQRVIVLAFFLLSVFLIFDYRGWQGKVPFCDKSNSKILRIVVGIFLLFSVVLAILVIFENVLSAL